MVEIEDIEGGKTLAAWLDQVVDKKDEDRSRRITLFLAHRAALRVLPCYWRWTHSLDIQNAQVQSLLQFLRASICSEVARSFPEADLGETVSLASSPSAAAIRAAVAAFVSTGAAKPADAFASGKAAQERSKKRRTSALNEAGVGDAVDAVLFLEQTVANLWYEIRADAELALSSKYEAGPLWSGDNPFAEVWADVKSATMSAPEGLTHWSFWRCWYDDVLKGGPPRNPELLKAVALIDPEDWDKGPGFINDVKIPELQAEHARHIASTAAEIVRDEATGAFTEVAVGDLEDGLFRDARERANEAIADFRAFIDRPQSPYGAFAEDLDVIETQIARAADRPIRAYENLADAMLVVLDIAKYNGLEADGRVTRLVREFERSRRDLRADDDKIAAREAKRIRIGYDELMVAEQADFRAMLVGFAEKSDETLEEEMKEDEAAIASTETLEGVRDRALLRSSERMVQMDGIEKEEAKRTSLEEVGKKADAVNKVAKAGETIGKIVEWFLT